MSSIRSSNVELNLHEMRDVATSYLHVLAKGGDPDMDTVNLWCGQVGEIDPLRYDKFYKHAAYVADFPPVLQGFKRST